jgi:hypothetical protein
MVRGFGIRGLNQEAQAWSKAVGLLRSLAAAVCGDSATFHGADERTPFSALFESATSEPQIAQINTDAGTFNAAPNARRSQTVGRSPRPVPFPFKLSPLSSTAAS